MRTEYSSLSPRHKIVDGLASLARHSGLAPERIVELAEENRLFELFDPETRSLRYRNGVELLSMASNKRSPMRGMDPHTALALLRAKKRAWARNAG